MVDSLENDRRCSIENEDVVGVGRGELGVVEGVDSGGNVMTSFLMLDNLAMSPNTSAAILTSGSSMSLMSEWTSCVIDIGDDVLWVIFDCKAREEEKKRGVVFLGEIHYKYSFGVNQTKCKETRCHVKPDLVS